MNPKNLTPNLIRKLSGSDGSVDGNMDHALALLCQVTLALLIVFVMMNVFFRSKMKAEVDEAKGKVAYYKERWDEVRSSEPGQEYEKKEKVLIELQRQKLIKELDKVEAEDRLKLGLSLFIKPNASGQPETVTINILKADKIVDAYFISGCQVAKEKLASQDQMKADWLFRTLSLAGMQLAEGQAQVITQSENIVTADNCQWLKAEIDKKIGGIYVDCCNLQRSVLTELQRYYRQNPDALKNTQVYSLIKRYPAATPEEQGELISLISDGLYQYVKSVFDTQGVPLLSEV